MNSSRFFLVQILLFCFHYVANVQSQKEKALVLDLTDYRLIEIDENHETSQCDRCITACAASPDSKEEQQIEKDASMDGRAIFLREVYNNEDETRKIETDTCKKPLSPAIIYCDLTLNFLIGFEMFYDEKKIELSNWFHGNYYEKVIEGGQKTEKKERTNNEFIKTYYEKGYLGYLIFQLLFGSKQILRHYWITVFFARVSPDQKRRIITYREDVINDFFHKTPSISRCENYFLEGASKANGSLLRSLPKRDKEDTSTEEQADQETTSIENRLEATQILPMQMFHTYSARLATCMYVNIAYIWNNVANGPLKEVDLFLYSMYRLWPEQVQIQYAVQGEIKIDSGAIASENQLFHRYPVPEIIYRIVEWHYKTEEYKAVVVIHNDPNPVKDEDRICPNPIKSWNVMNENMDTAIGQSYTCPYSTDVISKLQLDERTPETALDLDNFPQIVVLPNTSIHHANVTQQIRNELDRHKKQQ